MTALALAESWAAPVRALIVEDDRACAVVIQELLARCDCVADIADDASAALSMLVTGNYDIVFVDLILPDGTGIDVVRAAKQQDPSMPVVVVTGVCDMRILDSVLRCGVVAILQKPYCVSYEQFAAILAMFKVRANMRAPARTAYASATA